MLKLNWDKDTFIQSALKEKLAIGMQVLEDVQNVSIFNEVPDEKLTLLNILANFRDFL